MKNNKNKNHFINGLINVSLLFPAVAYCQTPIDVNSLNASYVMTNSSVEISTAKTVCSTLTINCGEAYTDSYNSSDGTNQGDLVLNPIAAFTLSGIPYNLRFSSNNVSYQRVVNPIATTTGVDLIQYEHGDIENLGEPNNTVALLPSKKSSSEEALSDQTINDGAESIFQNFRTSFQLVNTDVERIDIIFNSGVKTSAPQNAGFLIAERGGNDNIKLAAITELSPLGQPSEYGVLTQISSADWAIGINRLLQTISYVSENNGINYGAFGANSPQYITANFISFQDFGITADQVIYGYSIFPGDVDPLANPSQILIDPDTYPKNTEGLDGGLDLVYASGAFDNDNKLVNLQVNAVPSLSTYGILVLILMLISFGTVKKQKDFY